VFTSLIQAYKSIPLNTFRIYIKLYSAGVAELRSDILKASILAVLTASLLGASTYFVSEQIPKEEHKPAVILDAFTPKGGQGSTIVSSSYFYNQNVSIFALIKDESDNPLANTSVIFQIYGPPNPYNNLTITETIDTNASGIAMINLSVPFNGTYPETVIGVWSVIVTAQIVQGEEIVDTLAFEVEQPPSPYVDLYTDRGGQGANIASPSYNPNDTVTLYARVSDGNDPVGGYFAAFSVFRLAEDLTTTVLVRTGQTNASGIASISFRLDPDPTRCLGSWQVLTRVMIKGQDYVDTLTFDCNP